MWLASAVEMAMYSDQLEALDRAVLRRMAEDLEDDGVAVREAYAERCRPVSFDGCRTWESYHAEAVADRDAALSRIKTQLARVNRALDAKRAAAAEAKAARKAARK